MYFVILYVLFWLFHVLCCVSVFHVSSLSLDYSLLISTRICVLLITLFSHNPLIINLSALSVWYFFHGIQFKRLRLAIWIKFGFSWVKKNYLFPATLLTLFLVQTFYGHYGSSTNKNSDCFPITLYLNLKCSWIFPPTNLPYFFLTISRKQDFFALLIINNK